MNTCRVTLDSSNNSHHRFTVRYTSIHCTVMYIQQQAGLQESYTHTHTHTQYYSHLSGTAPGQSVGFLERWRSGEPVPEHCSSVGGRRPSDPPSSGHHPVPGPTALEEIDCVCVCGGGGTRTVCVCVSVCVV